MKKSQKFDVFGYLRCVLLIPFAMPLLYMELWRIYIVLGPTQEVMPMLLGVKMSSYNSNNSPGT